MTNIVILCAGEQKRWIESVNKSKSLTSSQKINLRQTPKQLIELEGTPILQRTLNLLRDATKNSKSVITLNVSEKQRTEGTFSTIIKKNNLEVNVCEDKEINAMGDFKKIAQIFPILKPGTLILMGDVYFEDNTITNIIEDIKRNPAAPYHFWGRMENNKHEIFAIYIGDQKTVDTVIHATNTLKNKTRPGGWLLYRYLEVLPLDYNMNFFSVNFHTFTCLLQTYGDKHTNDIDYYDKDLRPLIEYIEDKWQPANAASPIKILFTREDWLPARRSGSIIYDEKIAQALLAKGYDVRVYTGTGDKWEHNGIPVNYVKDFCPTIIVTNSTQPARARAYCRAYGIPFAPIVGVIHNDSDGFTRMAEPEFVGFIANNSNALSRAQGKTELPVVKLTPYVKGVTQKKKLEKTLKTREHVTIINANKTKGGFFFKKLTVMARKINHSFKFLVVRGAWGNQTPITGQGITTVNTVEDVTPILDTTRVLLLPSERESWSITASEALARGVEVWTFDDLPGVIENLQGTGRLFNREDGTQVWLNELIALEEKSIDIEDAWNRVKVAQKHNRNHKEELKEVVLFFDSLLADLTR